METEELKKKERFGNKYTIIIVVLIGAWIIGISIVLAGLMISKEIAKKNVSTTNPVQTQEPPQQVNIDVPAGATVLGDNNAKVTIIEFADFQCPFCGEWQKTVFPNLKKNYIDNGKARFVFMDYAFLGDESIRAAEAARCANEQNKFWEYHDTLYESQKGENEGAFADINLKQFAKDLKLDPAKFNECFDSKKYQPDLTEDLNKASSLGVQSTPTVFINGFKYEGLQSYYAYSSAIEAELVK